MDRPRVAVCYVADLNFLYPALLSIASLRRFVGPDRADVFVFYSGQDHPAVEAFARQAAALSATVLPLKPEAQIAFDAGKWNGTHVSRSALGRFFIEGELPPTITRLLYIDGDTLFVGDPSPLLEADLPAGTIAAAEDVSYFCRDDQGSYGKTVRRYFNGLGISGANGYFNSGVILTDRSTWRRISDEAVAFFVANVGKCRYHDQSALNAVAGARRVRLSPAWNFQTPFRYWGVQREIGPKILHFTQFPKPWMGAIVPWADIHPTLRALADQFDMRALPVRTLDELDVPIYNQRNKLANTRLHVLLPLRLLRRRRDMRALVSSAII